MPEKKTVTDSHGIMWLNGGPDTDDHLSWGGHEPAIVQIATALLPPNGTFVDVGAHVGLYTLNLAMKATRVYAIEANPATYADLCENIAMNCDRLHAAVEAVNLAAWNEFTTLGLVDENGKATGGSTRCVYADDGTVQAVPLDSILRDVHVDLVKIDVEGAEFRVLHGMEETIDACHPTFLIEMHDTTYDLPLLRSDVLSFLESKGYEHDDSLTYGVENFVLATYGKENAPVEVVRPQIVAGGSLAAAAQSERLRDFVRNYKENR